MSAAAKLRGDDDILSLMDEMSSRQGYGANLASAQTSSGDSAADSLAPPQERVRLTSEIEGYSPLSNKEAGNDMIWNPFIQVSTKGRTTTTAACTSMHPFTNPQVEVLRRRAYERFKSQFRDSLERISVNATAKVGPSNLWSELSVPSMMERWHFDAKLQECLHCSKKDQPCIIPSATPNIQGSGVATFHIKCALERGGERIDPILLSPDFEVKKKRKRGEAQSHSPNDSINKPFESTFALLTDEVKFEWTRTWKRIAGEKYRESDLVSVFESKRFQKKLSRLHRSVMEAAAQVEEAFCTQVSKRAAMEAQQSTRPFKKSSAPKIVVQEDGMVHVTFSGLLFRVNNDHYLKLQMMFDRVHPNAVDRTLHESAFASSLFCLLARYDMLQGAGLQASVPGTVFDVLLKHYGCRLECFASPLNSRYERFFSAFVDTDGPFGSLGSFFDHDFAADGGCYQANPPFTTSFLTTMHDKMDRALQKCEAPLMFIVFVPAWRETTGWNLLHSSSFLTKHVHVSQSSHYYTEGTQHRRKDRYRVASFDTSVFFLLNEAARSKWTMTNVEIDNLRSAFQSDPNQQVQGNVDSASEEDAMNAVNSTNAERPKKVVKQTHHRTINEGGPTEKPKGRQKKAKGVKVSGGGDEGSRQLKVLHSLGGGVAGQLGA